MTRSESGKLGGIKSRESSKNLYITNLNKYNDNPKFCLFCGNKIEYDKRRNDYCRRTCSASANNILFPKNKLGINGRLDLSKEELLTKNKRTYIQCLNCSELTKNPKFCTIECKKNYHKKEFLLKIQTGTYSSSSNFYVKAFLIDIRGIKCEICLNTKWMNLDIPLILDHIDGNHNNWNLENLRLVCGNCDMQLPTYKSKNKGNGRYARRIRYQEGKSY